MKGWYKKYKVEKCDGTPVNPGAVYFVLRLDTDHHARVAAAAYAASIEEDNRILSYDIQMELLRIKDMDLEQRDIIQCEWCRRGDKPKVLDKDGVLAKLSGELGTLCHSYGDEWWLCERA